MKQLLQSSFSVDQVSDKHKTEGGDKRLYTKASSLLR